MKIQQIRDPENVRFQTLTCLFRYLCKFILCQLLSEIWQVFLQVLTFHGAGRACEIYRIKSVTLLLVTLLLSLHSDTVAAGQNQYQNQNQCLLINPESNDVPKSNDPPKVTISSKSQVVNLLFFNKIRNKCITLSHVKL